MSETMSRGEVMKLIRLFAVIAACLVCYAIADAAVSAAVHADGSDHSWEAISAFSALGGAGMAAVITLGCAARLTLTDGLSDRRKHSPPRPDYALIAEIEREVYGEAFHHDGAPEVGSASPMTALGDVMLQDALNAFGACTNGHQPTDLYHSASKGKVFCGRCEAMRYLKPPGPPPF